MISIRLVCALAALFISSSLAHSAQLSMPAGATAYMEWSDQQVCLGDCASSTSLGVGNGILSTTVTNPLAGTFATGFAEMTPAAFRGLLSTNSGTDKLSGSILETYTVQGTGSGPVSLTVTLRGTGTFSSVAALVTGTQILSGAGAQVEIGTFNTSTALTNEQGRVESLGGESFASFSHPTQTSANGSFSGTFDISAHYTLTANIGTSFDLAYGYSLAIAQGTITLDSGSSVAWDVPANVSLTSARGAVFTAAAPVPEPGTWAMMFAGLGVVCVRARKRK